ncbi:hypothetical protein D3C80_1244630 [compost metagenome]
MRQLRIYSLHPVIKCLTETLHIACGRHGNGKPDGRVPVHPKYRCWWFSKLTTYGGDIRKRDKTIVNVEGNGTQALFTGQRSANLQRNVILTGTNNPGRLDGILAF